MPVSRLFPSPPRPADPAALAFAEAPATEVGALAGDGAAAQRFLAHVWFPASRRWRYQLNGKSGNTFTLQLLFRLEFGVDISARGQTAANQHPELAVFQTREAGLLSNSCAEDPAEFTAFPGLSVATVRNPYSRALSAYRYLCRSQRLADMRFLKERLRLNALGGFDWDRDPGTVAGFAKFLGYVEEMLRDHPSTETDAHWLPQVLHIRPGVYRPDLIGRTENMVDFARRLIGHLAPDAPVALDGLAKNAAEDGAKVAEFLADATITDRIQAIYADDFAAFGYSLDPAQALADPDAGSVTASG